MARKDRITVDLKRLEACEVIAVDALMQKGMTYRQIRETLGLPLGTITNRRLKLKDLKASFVQLGKALDD